MIPLFICVVLVTLFLRYLRSRVIVKTPTALSGQGGPRPEDFIPDYEKAHQKFGKQRQERQERAQKELEDKIKAQEQNGMFSLFDQEMEWLKAKRDYEREHPLRKRSTFEGALALCELMQEERERKAALAKIKRDIFENPASAKASASPAAAGTGTSETMTTSEKEEMEAEALSKVAAELQNLIRQRRENKSSSSSGSKSNYENLQGSDDGARP